MNRFVLNEDEIREIKTILSFLVSEYSFAENPEFLRLACMYAHELPRRLRRSITDFMTFESGSGVFLLSGYELDTQKIGPTPAHWKGNSNRSSTQEEEMLLVLFGSLLGDLFGWYTQQDGRIIHDVMPIMEHENRQIGTGSRQLIWWHNEDAFHQYRGDYVGMMCLRNPDLVATTIGCIDHIDLTNEKLKLLFEPRYIIRPDESHQVEDPAGGASKSQAEASSAHRRIEQMNISSEKLSVLFGNPESPYVRLDPYFMSPLEDDPEAQEALNLIIRSIDAVIQNLVLKPGDCVFIDNYKAVHGRQSFEARYDGNDRWLKRINITKDLRKSRDSRASCTDRRIY